MKNLITTSLLAGLIFVSSGTPEYSIWKSSVEARQEWVLLGQRRVRDNIDHDTIRVSIFREDFRFLKIKAEDHAIEMIRMVVHYHNGGSEELEIRQLIRAGGESRPINLRGGDRSIQKIDFWYEAKSLGREGASIEVYGSP